MLTIEEIQDRHASRVSDLLTNHASLNDLTPEQRFTLDEATRLDYVAMYDFLAGRVRSEAPVQGETKPRKGSTPNLIAGWLSEHIGETVGAAQIAEAVGTSQGSAYAYIDANRSAFKKVGRGVYEVVDVDAARAAAGKKIAARMTSSPRLGAHKPIVSTLIPKPAEPTTAERAEMVLNAFMGNEKPKVEDDDIIFGEW